MAKFRKVNWKSKTTWKNILVIGLAIITLIGAIVGLSALFRKSEETTKEISPSWAIGGLTEQGAYLETKESIYTKDAFGCQGLNIKIDFDNNISYRVFFYDYNDNFVSSTSKLTANYNEDISPLVKSARIVITPNEDSKISWYEKSGYAKQLTISVDKKQLSFVDKLSTYENKAVFLGQGSWDTLNGGGFTQTSTPFYFFDKVDVSNANTMILKVKNETLTTSLSYGGSTFSVPMFYDGTTDKVVSISYNVLQVVDKCTYIGVDVSNYSSVFCCVDVQSVDFLEIFVV